MSKGQVLEKSKAASKAFLDSDIYKNSKTIMVYVPLGNETDTMQILKTALKDKKRCILPVTDAKTGVVTPCMADENTRFIKGAFSVLEPEEKVAVSKEEIDVFIVPGIAFDKSGARVGFGKGC